MKFQIAARVLEQIKIAWFGSYSTPRGYGRLGFNLEFQAPFVYEYCPSWRTP